MTADDPLLKKLKEELQPELDRLHADHDRHMRLIAQMPPLTEAQKREIQQANSPEGWEAALADVLGHPKQQSRSKAAWLVVLAVACAILIATAIVLILP